MKKISNKLFLCIAASSLLFTSCYKKFDTESYAPPFTISGFSSVSQIQPTALVGYWSFDGNLLDSVSGTAGVNTETTFVPGFKGQAMQGGIGKYVLFTPGATIKALHSFTLSYWVNTPPPSVGIIGTVSLSNPTAFWGNIDVFYENGGTNAAGKFRAHISNGPNDKEIPKDGMLNLFSSWTNITLSYDGATSTSKIYKDGNLVDTKVQTNGAAPFGNVDFTNSGQMVFGCNQFMTTPSLTSAHGAEGWASFLTGQLDEVRMYSTVLLDKEVNAMVILQGKGK
ncbi:MAG: LamG-like jellyroll fold domain-containing protein [Ferruginibacter sp.]